MNIDAYSFNLFGEVWKGDWFLQRDPVCKDPQKSNQSEWRWQFIILCTANRKDQNRSDCLTSKYCVKSQIRYCPICFLSKLSLVRHSL
jgi:hypothetical protein